MKQNASNKINKNPLAIRSEKTDRGYDEAVQIPGHGLEGQGELIAAPSIADEFDDKGMPVWDDTERAAPPASASSDGEEFSVPPASVPINLSAYDLRKRAQALGIPGRSKMSRVQLANAVRNSIGPS